MSNLRDKAKAVYAEGVDQRGEFTPTGVPLKVYKYWAERAKKPPVRENFCHFWRVVAIWAPLMWVRKTASAAADKTAVQATAALIALAGVVAACILSADVLETLLTAAGILVVVVLAIIGLFSGISVAMPEDERERADMPPIEFAKWGFFVLPVSIPAFIVTKFVRNQWVKDHGVEISLGAIVTAILATITTLSFTETYWVAIIAAIVVVSAYPVGWALTKIVSFVADWLAGKRKIAEMKASAYRNGEITYEEAFGHPKREAKELSKFEKKVIAFFKGIGDFVILVAQVIRVNKWKICPTVEVK